MVSYSDVRLVRLAGHGRQGGAHLAKRQRTGGGAELLNLGKNRQSNGLWLIGAQVKSGRRMQP